MNAFGTSYRGTSFSERMADAPCLTTDPNVGFPGGEGKRGKAADVAHLTAKSLCADCPIAVKTECLEVAMKTEGAGGAGNRHGVFGGLDPEERAALAKQRRATAPRPHSSDHGTPGRAAAHRRAGEAPCGVCLEAEAAATRERYRKRVAA